MKRVSFLFFTLLWLSINALAQDDLQTDTSSVTKAEITFKSEIHDFGTIEYKGNGTYEFEFKNTGKEPLILNKVTSSCGCTVPEWSKDPIQPKDKGKIIVKYDTNRAGKFQKSITVYSNAANNPVHLTIKGEVLPQQQNQGTGQD